MSSVCAVSLESYTLSEAFKSAKNEPKLGRETLIFLASSYQLPPFLSHSLSQRVSELQRKEEEQMQELQDQRMCCLGASLIALFGTGISVVTCLRLSLLLGCKIEIGALFCTLEFLETGDEWYPDTRPIREPEIAEAKILVQRTFKEALEYANTGTKTPLEISLEERIEELEKQLNADASLALHRLALKELSAKISHFKREGLFLRTLQRSKETDPLLGVRI